MRSCLIDLNRLKVNGWCACLPFLSLFSSLDCLKEWTWMRKKALGVMKITDEMRKACYPGSVFMHV